MNAADPAAWRYRVDRPPDLHPAKWSYLGSEPDDRALLNALRASGVFEIEALYDGTQIAHAASGAPRPVGSFIEALYSRAAVAFSSGFRGPVRWRIRLMQGEVDLSARIGDEGPTIGRDVYAYKWTTQALQYSEPAHHERLIEIGIDYIERHLPRGPTSERPD